MSDGVAAQSALGDFAGWIVFAANFLLPLMSREIRRDHRLALVFWFSLLLRQALALGTGFISGPYSDANWFHQAAINRARDGGVAGVTMTVGGEFYERLLGAAYDVLGTSPFLAAELSVLAFSASILVFSNLLRDLGIVRYRVALLMLYCLPFSALYFTSTVLRETYQLLGFMLAVHFALRYKLTASPTAMLLSFASALVMGLFHDGLIVFSALFILLVILWPMGAHESALVHRSYRLARRVSAGLLLVLIAFAGVQRVTGGMGSGALTAVISKRALEYAAKYREGGLQVEARTNYNVRLDTSSPAAFVMSVVLVFVFYMFSPFPWQIRGPADMLGGTEAILRFLLLVFALREWRRTSGIDWRIRSFLLLAYVALAGLWSLGTVNYGTAYRHHVTTNWILLLLGGPAILDAVVRLIQRLFWAGPRAPRRAVAASHATGAR